MALKDSANGLAEISRLPGIAIMRTNEGVAVIHPVLGELSFRRWDQIVDTDWKALLHRAVLVFALKHVEAFRDWFEDLDEDVTYEEAHHALSALRLQGDPHMTLGRWDTNGKHAHGLSCKASKSVSRG